MTKWAQAQQEIEQKWQAAWEEAKIFEAQLSDKPKFYLVFAYPTVSGTMHIGHMRSYVLPDIIARYKRMKGFEVFFPVGFHATGVDCQKILRECKENAEVGARKYGIEVEAARKFETPLDVEKYLEKKILAAYKTFGLSVDARAVTSTIDEHYSKFIQWQYRKLRERPNYLIQGDYVLPYCPSCDHPVSVDTAAADLAEGSEAEAKQYNVIKFRDREGHVWPVATLRPETVFGVTNMWVHPDANYVIANVDDEVWIVAEPALEKLQNLGKNIVIREIVKGGAFARHIVINPATEEEIEIILAEFVDPEEATGVVMSVPAHDPYDYVYYKKFVGAPDESIPLVVDIPIKGVPSAEILKKHRGNIEEALKELYKLEYRHKIRDDVPVIGGIPTPEAKAKTIEFLKTKNAIDEMYEFTQKRVECRCGAKIIFKKIKGQWFTNYANVEWKQKVKEAIARMETYPPEYKQELPYIIDWLKERPLVRRQGLGTAFPFGEGIIEPLADSTIYMAFYFVSKAVNEGKLKADELDDAFFDYVFYGKEGKLRAKKEVADEVRAWFLHFYPLDVNFGGKEHKSVHFPFFIYHHVALFPEHCPRGIFVNWHLIREGEKMSKSKGNVIFWDDAIARYSADGVRIYEAHGASQWADFDWKDDEAERYVAHLKSLQSLFDVLVEECKFPHEESTLSQWLESSVAKKISEIENNLKSYEIRKAAGIAFFDIRNDIQWFRARGGRVWREILEDWLKVLSPFIPHTCEEWWHALGNTTFVSAAKWPEKKKIDEGILKLEDELLLLIEDLNNLLKLTGPKKKLWLYAATDAEVVHLRGAVQFLRTRYGFEEVNVVKAAITEYDPMKKAAKAKEGKPAIYLE